MVLSRRSCTQLAFLCAALNLGGVCTGQEPVKQSSATAWTTEAALRQMELQPSDPYLQFVVAQLLLQENRLGEMRNYLPRTLSARAVAAQRNRAVDLYSIFSASLAIQESLQLDALTDESPAVALEAKVELASLQGPTVKSHPWQAMLAGQTPQTSPLADCIPADQLYVRFGSVSKLLQLRRLGEDWNAYVTSQTQHRSDTTHLVDRLQTQLAIQTSDVLQRVYDAMVEEIAITSSDLFFREGTDTTLVLRLKQPALIRPQLDGFLAFAASQHTDAVVQDSQYLGIDVRHVGTPNRSVHVYSAYPTPNIHVRSNSRIALERILSTIVGKPWNGQRMVPLSATDEFRYIRTLMPLGAEQEDGLVYMSDPFIRQLIGPEKKLTQRNRLVCRSRLQMLSYAGLLHQTQFSKSAASIGELSAGGCLGTAENVARLECPSGGEYSFNEDGLSGTCSHHGTLATMVPCCEIPLSHVSQQEADEFEQFVQNYSQYWRTFFDPIAIRIQATSKQTRLETIVLPLIDNSIYSGLATALGGVPEMLDSLPVPESNIFSIGLRLDRERLLERFRLPPPTPDDSSVVEEDGRLDSRSLAQLRNSFLMIGLAAHNFESTYKHLPPLPTIANRSTSGLSWRVHILPFIDERKLYDEFHLDEPWDSDHNKQLIAKMPGLLGEASPGLAAQGKTRFVFPFHAQAIYHNRERGAGFRDIIDGLSNTILCVLADEENAVIWTKPDDLDVDLDEPRKGWSQGIGGFVPLLLADGSIIELPATADDAAVRNLLTRNGGEPNPIEFERVGQRRSSGFNDLSQFPLVRELALDDLLHNGIGNQIGFHVCDADPLVDFNVSRFLGMLTSSFRGGGFDFFDSQSLIAVLAVSLNVPVYFSIPVEDAQVVDRTLEKLDEFLVRFARQQSESAGGFFQIEQDFYRVNNAAEVQPRAYAFQFGPLTWRFYWARIGEGLYVASKPFIIDELLAARDEQAGLPAKEDAGHAHGMLRVRPLHWQHVLPHYRIGWAESERRACMNNLGPLSSVLRALPATDSSDLKSPDLDVLAGKVFQRHYVCPSHGAYLIDHDRNAVHCSVHGSQDAPLQPIEGKQSRIAEMTSELRDVRFELTFLEDGLHAVVTLAREPR